MIKTVEDCDLPMELYGKLYKKWDKIYYISLRELSNKTGLSINTLRKLRQERKASIRVWRILSEKL